LSDYFVRKSAQVQIDVISLRERIFFDVLMTAQQLVRNAGRTEVLAHHFVEFFRAASMPAGKKINEAGVMFGIGVDAGVAFRKQHGRCHAISRENILGGFQQCRTGSHHRSLHGIDDARGLDHSFMVAFKIIGDQMTARELITLFFEFHSRSLFYNHFFHEFFLCDAACLRSNGSF